MTASLSREEAIAFLREHYFTPGELATAEAYECEAVQYLRSAAANPRRFCDRLTDVGYDSYLGGGVSVWRGYRWGPGVKPDYVISFDVLARACVPESVAVATHAAEETLQPRMF